MAIATKNWSFYIFSLIEAHLLMWLFTSMSFEVNDSNTIQDTH